MTQHDQRSHAKDVLATSFETLSCQLAAPHVLLVSLNRPSVGNAINTQMGRDLLRLWTMLTEDAEDIRCIVLAGTGNRIFCAGGEKPGKNSTNFLSVNTGHSPIFLYRSLRQSMGTPMPADLKQCSLVILHTAQKMPDLP
jgi:1,4-dihydroxy-2-naphthoyl-CoA synthase